MNKQKEKMNKQDEQLDTTTTGCSRSHTLPDSTHTRITRETSTNRTHSNIA